MLKSSIPQQVCGILGGAEVADEIQLIMDLFDKVGITIVRYGMAFTLLKVSAARLVRRCVTRNVGARP